MFHHFSLASYVQIENPNVLKHIINNNLEESKLSFIVWSLAYIKNKIKKISKFWKRLNKKWGPLKARKMKMGAPILHTLAHPAHSLRPLLIKYTSFYDGVFTCLHNSSLRLIRHFFLIPLRWRIRQILLYYAFATACRKPEKVGKYCFTLKPEIPLLPHRRTKNIQA